VPRPKSTNPTYSLAKRGKFYVVQWWDGGKSRRVSCGTSDKGEAQRFLAEFKAGIDAPAIPPSPTIGAVLDGYLAERGPRTHSQTIRYCCEALKRHLADLPVELLTKVQVRSYVAARRESGSQGASAVYRETLRPLSDGTLIRELGTLRAALAWAVRERWIPTAPYVERPSAPRARERWLTHEEASKLLEAAHAQHIRLFIGLALYTGARAGALLQLTWSRVDLDAGTINLGEARGKKRRPRLPIPDELAPILALAAATATIPYVIEFAGGPVASIKTGFGAACRRAGLENVTPHILRHTAATWMVQRGVPKGMVAAWLGNTEQMVETVYGHHSPDWLRQAAEALTLSSQPRGRGNRLPGNR